MASVVEICNSALDKLGTQPITSLDDTTKESRLCNSNFPLSRDAVLAMHPWTVATKRVVLAPLTATPVFEWTFQHQIPADSLRILAVGESEIPVDYRIEGQVILSNTQTLEVIYIFRAEATETYNPSLAETIAGYLAWQISFSLTQSRTVKEEQETDFNILLQKAKSTDAQEEPSKELDVDVWLEARVTFPGIQDRGRRDR